MFSAANLSSGEQPQPTAQPRAEELRRKNTARRSLVSAPNSTSRTSFPDGHLSLAGYVALRPVHRLAPTANSGHLTNRVEAEKTSLLRFHHWQQSQRANGECSNPEAAENNPTQRRFLLLKEKKNTSSQLTSYV